MPSTAAEVSVQEAAAGQVGVSIIPECTHKEDSSREDIQVHVNFNRTHPAEAKAAYAPANGDEGLNGNRAGLGKVLLLNPCGQLLLNTSAQVTSGHSQHSTHAQRDRITSPPCDLQNCVPDHVVPFL